MFSYDLVLHIPYSRVTVSSLSAHNAVVAFRTSSLRAATRAHSAPCNSLTKPSRIFGYFQRDEMPIDAVLENFIEVFCVIYVCFRWFQLPVIRSDHPWFKFVAQKRISPVQVLTSSYGYEFGFGSFGENDVY